MGAQTNNPFSKATAGQSGDHSGGYGVTQTNGKGQSVPQIDPSAALAYYAQAGQTEANGIAAGNTAYQTALKQAAGEMISGYNNANATLQPLSSASNQALTLFQQMLGITPESPTSHFGSNLTQIDPSLSATAQLINQANASQDPTQRAALSQQIQQQISAAASQGVTAANAAISTLGPDWTPTNPGPGLRIAEGGTGIGGLRSTASGQGTPGTPGNVDPGAIYAQNQAAWNAANSADQSALTTAQARQQELNQFNTQWGNTFNTAAPPQGFTGNQATQMLASTPGYQFQLNQGNQQVLRNQAAIGNLGTGNTQVALENYGQGLAQNTYNGFMSNLGYLINAGSPATMQIATNQANQGGYLSNLTQLGGQAQNVASTAEGNAIGAAQTQQGNAAYNAAAFNTQLQYDAFAMNNANSQAAQAQAMNLAGSAQQTSNQNASGAGFYQGMNSVTGAANNGINQSGFNLPTSNGGSY